MSVSKSTTIIRLLIEECVEDNYPANCPYCGQRFENRVEHVVNDVNYYQHVQACYELGKV